MFLKAVMKSVTPTRYKLNMTIKVSRNTSICLYLYVRQFYIVRSKDVEIGFYDFIVYKNLNESNKFRDFGNK